MNIPKYTIEKIEFATDSPTYRKACELYETGKVILFDDNGFTYTAKVKGTEVYQVVVDSKFYDRGDCNCYLGKNDTLCKHMVAVAIQAVLRGEKIPNEEREKVSHPVCSNQLGVLTTEELANTKILISEASKFIKAYSGPSRIWFAYQDSLSEGVSRLSTVVSKLPVSPQTADLLVSLILRLDKKLINGGVDDSDGTVGGFISDTVDVLKEFSKKDANTIKSFKKLVNISTCFDWEDELVKIYNETI